MPEVGLGSNSIRCSLFLPFVWKGMGGGEGGRSEGEGGEEK